MRILVVGVGGQGVLTAARILGEAILAGGTRVVVGQQHGMSQRGGTVENTLVTGEAETPFIGPGEADLVLAFEPIEAERVLSRMSNRTTALINTQMLPPTWLAIAGQTPPAVPAILSRISKITVLVRTLDAPMLAERAGSPGALNMVMLGAASGLGLLPAGEAELSRAIERASTPRTAQASGRAFKAGVEAFPSKVVLSC